MDCTDRTEESTPETFQRAMCVKISPVKWKFALVYLEDAVVSSNTVEDQICYFDQFEAFEPRRCVVEVEDMLLPKSITSAISRVQVP